MGKLLALLGGWQGYLAAALVAAGLSYYVTSLGYKITIANMRSAQATAAMNAANLALLQFTDDAKNIHSAAQSFGTIRDDLSGKLATISRDLRHAISSQPLPVDCKPDAVRLRSLSAAVAATNTTAGLVVSPIVPAHP